MIAHCFRLPARGRRSGDHKVALGVSFDAARSDVDDLFRPKLAGRPVVEHHVHARAGNSAGGAASIESSVACISQAARSHDPRPIYT